MRHRALCFFLYCLFFFVEGLKMVVCCKYRSKIKYFSICQITLHVCENFLFTL